MKQLIFMNFGDAIEKLKNGEKIARCGWNGKNMFIYLNKGCIDYRSLKNIDGSLINKEDLGEIDGVHLSLFECGDAGIITRMPNINMKTASGNIVTGWLASQTDILASDWIVLK